jgi:hypothetical protein
MIFENWRIDMAKDLIKVGDRVRVCFNNAHWTLTHCAVVEYMPCVAGDSWVFRDDNTGQIYYVSEGCTISKIET